MRALHPLPAKVDHFGPGGIGKGICTKWDEDGAGVRAGGGLQGGGDRWVERGEDRALNAVEAQEGEGGEGGGVVLDVGVDADAALGGQRDDIGQHWCRAVRGAGGEVGPVEGCDGRAIG